MAHRTGARNTSSGSKLLVYLQCYFVTIATILGTGILGLPVTLSRSGIYPFLASFIASTFMQGLLIYYFTDLLQRSYAVQLNPNQDELVPLQDMGDDSEDELYNRDKVSDVTFYGEGGSSKHPNLHLMGELFLGCGVRQAFDIMIILQFVALLISYALAGSEAVAELIGISHVYVIPAFVWGLSFAVVFALKLIQPVVSILTFLKGSLLLGTTIITFYIGISVGRDIHNDFKYVGEPFLMGTVALGGIINTMPFVFEKIEYKSDQIRKFRLSVLLGLITCSILNILWCIAVLEIVPQTIELACAPYEHGDTVWQAGHTTPAGLDPDMTPGSEVCMGELSLESAEKYGEISTLPLTKILHKDYPSFSWVAILVELFIVISIAVSYLTMGTALHHTLSGWVESHWSKDSFSRCIPKYKNPESCNYINGKWVLTTISTLAAFAVVFTVAMLNPQGFVVILEKFASFTLNTQAGIFVFLMVLQTRGPTFRNMEVALPLPSWLVYLVFLLPLYFGFAVVYDVYSMVYLWVAGTHHSFPGVHLSNPANATNATDLTNATDAGYTINNYTTVPSMDVGYPFS